LCDDCKTKLVQRVDDTPEAIQKRLDWFHKDTKPMLGRYEKQGILHRIDGTPSIEEVEKAVWSIFA
ncbi:MAG: adenylate kinase, partial [Patescibacteria group bacterium]|nr:adenylate kinase [Patescibacteria group bacterium]